MEPCAIWATQDRLSRSGKLFLLRPSKTSLICAAKKSLLRGAVLLKVGAYRDVQDATAQGCIDRSFDIEFGLDVQQSTGSEHCDGE